MYHAVLNLKDTYPILAEGGRNPYVQVYLPEPMTEMNRGDWKRPCMLICPGGGYGMTSDREAEPIALQFLAMGYNVFILRYSVAPNRFPVQLQEVAAAMELIYENSESWHCDTSRIAILGFSAGGHLAAHYSTCYHIPEVRAMFPDSKPVQASVLCYPVISADPNICHLGSFQNLVGVETLSQEQIEKFSCDRQVTDQTPPAFLWHTATDDAVPVANSLVYARALADRKIPFSLHVYPAGGHGLSTVDHQTNPPLSQSCLLAADWLNTVKKWLDIILGNDARGCTE